MRWLVLRAEYHSSIPRWQSTKNAAICGAPNTPCNWSNALSWAPPSDLSEKLPLLAPLLLWYHRIMAKLTDHPFQGTSSLLEFQRLVPAPSLMYLSAQ